MILVIIKVHTGTMYIATKQLHKTIRETKLSKITILEYDRVLCSGSYGKRVYRGTWNAPNTYMQKCGLQGIIH